LRKELFKDGKKVYCDEEEAREVLFKLKVNFARFEALQANKVELEPFNFETFWVEREAWVENLRKERVEDFNRGLINLEKSLAKCNGSVLSKDYILGESVDLLGDILSSVPGEERFMFKDGGKYVDKHIFYEHFPLYWRTVGARMRDLTYGCVLNEKGNYEWDIDKEFVKDKDDKFVYINNKPLFRKIDGSLSVGISKEDISYWERFKIRNPDLFEDPDFDPDMYNVNNVLEYPHLYWEKRARKRLKDPTFMGYYWEYLWDRNSAWKNDRGEIQVDSIDKFIEDYNSKCSVLKKNSSGKIELKSIDEFMDDYRKYWYLNKWHFSDKGPSYIESKHYPRAYPVFIEPDEEPWDLIKRMFTYKEYYWETEETEESKETEEDEETEELKESKKFLK